MEDTSYVSLSIERYNKLYDKAKEYDELVKTCGETGRFDLGGIKFTDETGYVLISEIIKAHMAEHNTDGEVMSRCQHALQILDMLKGDA